MVIQISNLPRFEGRTLRALKVKPLNQLPQQIKLREGMTLSQAAHKIGIAEQTLTSLGISQAEINLDQLREGLETGIPEEIGLRAGEERSVDNVISAIVGRLGREHEILERFSIDELFEMEGARFSALFDLYEEKLEPNELARFRQEIDDCYHEPLFEGSELSGAAVLASVRTQASLERGPDRSPYGLGQLISTQAVEEFADKPRLLITLILGAIDDAKDASLFPTDLPGKVRFAEGILHGLEDHPFLPDLSVIIMEEIFPGLVEETEKMTEEMTIKLSTVTEIPSQARVIHQAITSAPTLSLLPLRTKAECVAGVLSEIYPDNFLARIDLASHVARLLYSKDAFSAESFISEVRELSVYDFAAEINQAMAEALYKIAAETLEVADVPAAAQIFQRAIMSSLYLPHLPEVMLASLSANSAKRLLENRLQQREYVELTANGLYSDNPVARHSFLAVAMEQLGMANGSRA